MVAVGKFYVALDVGYAGMPDFFRARGDWLDCHVALRTIYGRGPTMETIPKCIAWCMAEAMPLPQYSRLNISEPLPAIKKIFVQVVWAAGAMSSRSAPRILHTPHVMLVGSVQGFFYHSYSSSNYWRPFLGSA